MAQEEIMNLRWVEGFRKCWMRFISGKAINNVNALLMRYILKKY